MKKPTPNLRGAGIPTSPPANDISRQLAGQATVASNAGPVHWRIGPSPEAWRWAGCFLACGRPAIAFFVRARMGDGDKLFVWVKGRDAARSGWAERELPEI